MPLQRVVERDALADQPLAVIDEQPQVELGPVQLRGRQRRRGLRAAPRGRPRSRRCCRTCRARGRRGGRRPSAWSGRATTRSPRAIRNRSRTPDTCRQSSSAQTRSPSRPRAQTSSAREARGRRPGPSARRAARPSPQTTAAIVCERLWVSAPSTIIDPSTSTSMSGPPADTACWGRCHAPIKSRRTSPTGDERHNKRKSGPTRADSLKESQLAAGRDHLHGVGRHRQPESKQQASKRERLAVDPASPRP